MALIKCPECGKQVSDKAGSCPNCGCPIANAPTSIKIRALSDDRGVKRTKFTINGRVVAEIPIGSTTTINITQPTKIEMTQCATISKYGPWSFTAIPGKCYETRYCKPGLAFWTTVATEVSFV